jgi:hypothetical protein
MHHGQKADLMECQENLAPHPQDSPQVDVRVFDGAALIHDLDPHKANGLNKNI